MKFIGHRGAMGLAQEHSKKGFEIAIAKGIDAIECDVQLTKDNQLVLHHDKSLYRIYNDKRSVAQVTLSELRYLADKAGKDVVTVNELLELTRGRANINFELKAQGTGNVLGDLLSKDGAVSVIVSSLNWGELRKLHEVAPPIKTAKIRRWIPFVFKHQIASLNMSHIGLRTTLANKFSIAHARKQGLQVYVWTLEDRLAAERFRRKGADMVVIDKP